LGGALAGGWDGGEFGETLAAFLSPLAAVELLRRPRLDDYIAWLHHSLGVWPGWVGEVQGVGEGVCSSPPGEGGEIGEGELNGGGGGEGGEGLAMRILYRSSGASGCWGERVVAWVLRHYPSIRY